jgi:25S rRNA (cytosine2278-C5)-methyltransferase
MSLYHDAASIISTSGQAGPLRERVYRNKNLKSHPAQVFALLSETAKWDSVLKEVVEKSSILSKEKMACAHCRKFSSRDY